LDLYGDELGDFDDDGNIYRNIIIIITRIINNELSYILGRIYMD
jgi:hypothetical protein